MTIKVMAKSERGCGTRNTKGYYLVCDGEGTHCHRLPLEVPICKECKKPYIVPIRGIQAIQPEAVWDLCEAVGTDQEHLYPCHNCANQCPICYPPEDAWVIWVGESYYESPEDFVREARNMGISRKIGFVPEGLQPGDWVYLGYRKLIPTGHFNKKGEEVKDPGIFHAFKIQRIEKLLTETQQQDQAYVRHLLERGIVPVVEVDDESQIEETKKRLYTKLSDFMDNPESDDSIEEEYYTKYSWDWRRGYTENDEFEEMTEEIIDRATESVCSTCRANNICPFVHDLCCRNLFDECVKLQSKEAAHEENTS